MNSLNDAEILSEFYINQQRGHGNYFDGSLYQKG